jgi:2-methylcitrate dehydratase PrpD
VRHAEITELRRRTEVIADPDCNPGQAKIAVHTKNRGVLAAEVPIQKGYATNPLTNEDVSEKFLNLADPVLGPARAQRAVELVYRLETVEDAGDVARLCA